MATPIINDLTDLDGNPIKGTGEKIREEIINKPVKKKDNGKSKIDN